MRQTPSRRAAKKTAMLEVRVSPDDKQDFLNACRAAGVSASMVIRQAMSRQVRIVQERTGRLKMMLTLALLLPMAGAISQDPAIDRTAATAFAACDPATSPHVPVWPVGADGAGLAIPAEGIRIILTYDRDASGLAVVTDVRAPEGYDAFVTAAVSSVRFLCLPGEMPGGSGYSSAFDFRPAPEEQG